MSVKNKPEREQTHTVDVVRVAHSGEGIAHIDGQVCFVPYGLPGDRLRVSVVKRTRRAVWAGITDLIAPSQHRIDTSCPVFGECGGCAWGHFAYPAQAEWKRYIVRDCFQRMAGADIDPEWKADNALRTGYRTCAQFHARKNIVGFYPPGSREPVNIDSCPLCHQNLNRTLQRLRAARINGTVKVTVNPAGEDVLVWKQRPHRRLSNLFDNVDHAGTKRRSQFLFDDRPVVNGAFVQSSLLLNRLLLEIVESAADPKSLLDLYCGNGNLSLGFAGQVPVLGLDKDAAAVRAAAAMGKGNYEVAGEAAFAAAIDNGDWDTIVLDPPRGGAKRIMPAVAQSGARCVIYVSCDPVTLARDAGAMIEAGYVPDRVTAIDMFPYTPHVEAVCRFTRAE